MALDHYISQVHLRNFYSPMLGNLMYALRKSDLRQFPCNSESVCRIEENSTNAYLIRDRAIEEFLFNVEPKYNNSIAKLRHGTIDPESILAVAGFAAYVGCCTPAATRIHSAPLQSMLQSEAAILDKQGLLPKAPPSLGGKSLSELLADGTVRSEIDPKFPQAVGISTVIHRASTYGNSRWEILQNNTSDSPFFTSDYPIALEAIQNHGVPNWIVPLAPDLAIRITPDIRLSRKPPDLSFANFSYARRQIAHREICALNRLIVQCAEDFIFYRDDHQWIRDFVTKYRRYRVEAVTERIPYGSGFLNMSTQRIVRSQENAQCGDATSPA